MTTTMTPTVTTSTTSTTSKRTATRSLWKVGASAGAVAAVATTAVAVVAKAVDIPMKAAPQTAEVGRNIPMNGYAVGTLMCTAIGIVIAVALARWSRRPAQLFVGVTTVLTLASFSGPITTGHATTATRLVLALTHVVAAAIVIPAIAACLAARSPSR